MSLRFVGTYCIHFTDYYSVLLGCAVFVYIHRLICRTYGVFQKPCTSETAGAGKEIHMTLRRMGEGTML